MGENKIESLINSIGQLAELVYVFYAGMINCGASEHEADVAVGAFVSSFLMASGNKRGDGE